MIDIVSLVRKCKESVASEHNLPVSQLLGDGIMKGDRALITIRNTKTKQFYEFNYPVN